MTNAYEPRTYGPERRALYDLKRRTTGLEQSPDSAIIFEGNVPTSGDLPTDPEPGDAWIAEDTDHGWQWNGTVWVDLGPVLEGPQGPQGVPGPQGPPGAPGAQGTPASIASRLYDGESYPQRGTVPTTMTTLWINHYDETLPPIGANGAVVNVDVVFIVDPDAL